MNDTGNHGDTDLTIPPVRTLRADTPAELYAQIPELGQFTQHRPADHEDPLQYLERLRASTTPEDAVTFAAFATVPRAAIAWAVDCQRMMLPDLGPEDRQLLIRVMEWGEHPGNATRWLCMQTALFAPTRNPVVYLGLAVGWSGGPLAPNDPSEPPAWRAPYAINAAILSSLAQAGGHRRSVNLARSLDLASRLFRVY